MPIELRPGAEELAALLALVVGAHHVRNAAVLLEMAVLSVPPVAHGALEFLLLVVYSVYVSHESAMLLKPGVAEVTAVPFSLGSGVGTPR